MPGVRCGEGGVRVSFRVSREPGGLLASRYRNLASGIGRNSELPGTGAQASREVFAGLDFGVLWRSAEASAEGELLGTREPGGAAVGVRRGKTLCRGGDDGVSPHASRGHADRAHL